VSLPVILGRGGIKKILELSLTDEEKKMFDESVKTIRANVEQIPPKYLQRIK
jgi:malate/lactate dehydrogenase